MLPKRLILIRHGESEANVDPVVYSQVPNWRIRLTETGISQAQDAGRKIAGLIGNESFGVFSSPYLRTKQTKNAMLNGMARDPVFDLQDPTLREQDYGNIPSPDENEANCAVRQQYGYFFYRFPEGESCADVYDRMALFLHTLYRRFEKSSCPENIIIVSHSTAIKCFLARWYHWSIEKFEITPQLPNCYVAVMQREDILKEESGNKFTLSEPFSVMSYLC